MHCSERRLVREDHLRGKLAVDYGPASPQIPLFSAWLGCNEMKGLTGTIGIGNEHVSGG